MSDFEFVRQHPVEADREHSTGELDGDLPEPTEEQDELQRKLAETYKRIRQTSDTAAIRRVNQQTKALLGRMGFQL